MWWRALRRRFCCVFRLVSVWFEAFVLCGIVADDAVNQFP